MNNQNHAGDEEGGEEDSKALGRILSIQSHVVHGIVGNKSAVFPLQLLGLDVDPINSVQFSNHTGYKVCKGDVLHGEQLLNIVSGLEANDLLTHYTHILTGYIGSASFLGAVVDVVRKIKLLNPRLTYVCDPVLGDDGRCYVPEPLVEMYRTKVLPIADILTPNQFEAEMLTGIEIKTESDAQRACLWLHAHGPSTVVITSATLEDDENLYVIASSRSGASWKACRVCKIVIPRVPGSYTGTGDLTAALLLAWLDRLPSDLNGALERAIAAVQATIARTHRVGANELQLVQSRKDIESPTITLRALPPSAPSQIKGVIYDMDGTLTTCKIDFSGIRRSLCISEGEDILTYIKGMANEEERAKALKYVEEEELRGFQEVRLNSGAEKVVSWMRQHKGFHVGLATRNNPAAVNILVNRFEWPEPGFSPILTRVLKSEEDVPQILEVCENWGLLPKEVLIVGDSYEDVAWGHKAGLQTCLIDIGASHMKDTVRSGFVHFTIESLYELIDIIGRE